MTRHIITLTIVLISFLSSTYAQDTWNWGTNPKEAKGNYMYMKTLTDAEKYDEAAVPASWLLKNAPELDVALYQLAGTIYQKRLKGVKDKEERKGLTDTLLYIYDKRMELFGDKAYVLNVKGLVAWPHLYKDKTKRAELYAMYKENYQLNGSETMEPNVFFYFTAAARQTENKLAETELLALYEELSAFLEKKGSKVALKYKGKLDEELEKHIKVDCDFVKRNYGPKFETSPDVDLAKKIQENMEKQKCTENELYISATNFLIEKEGPSYNNYKSLGNIYNNKAEYDKAYDYYTKAMELAPDDKDKATLYMRLAKIDITNGKKNAARSNIQAAMAKDESLYAEGHQLIGDLYMTSGSNCSSGDPLQDRLIYIAAYDEYKKAGNSSKMANAKAQFPSMEDIFVHNKKVGDSMSTGCWVSETVAIQKRD